MKNAIRTVAALAFAGAALLSASAANASCNSGWVKVIEVYQATNAVGTPYAYVYTAAEHTPLPTSSYYFYTADTTAITRFAGARQTNQTIYVNGSATTCPTSGAYLYGGTVQYVYDY